MVTMLQIYKTTRYLVVVPLWVYLVIYSRKLQWGVTLMVWVSR